MVQQQKTRAQTLVDKDLTRLVTAIKEMGKEMGKELQEHQETLFKRGISVSEVYFVDTARLNKREHNFLVAKTGYTITYFPAQGAVKCVFNHDGEHIIVPVGNIRWFRVERTD